jgi:hypothetical protein
MPVADVLLVSADPLQLDPEARESDPPLSGMFEVCPGVQLAGIEPDIASAVVKATQFRSPGKTDTSVMYGFVRFNPPGKRWDEDEAIAKALFLSHLVRAHEAGFEFTARVETDDKGRLVRLEPADVDSQFANAYCCPGARRRWLTQAETSNLGQLVKAYDEVLPALASNTRLGLAISVFLESPFVSHGRPRGLLLTTCLEGLVSTSPERAFKQFTLRVPALATEVGLGRFDRAWAERAYGLRCKLAHGVPLLPSASERDDKARRLDEYGRALTDVDELLRCLIRRALLDATFRERLQNVDVHWPVSGRGCPVCQSDDPQLLAVTCPRCKGTWR